MTILRSLAEHWFPLPRPRFESIIPLRARPDLANSPSAAKLRQLPEFLQVLPINGRHIIWFRIVDIHGSCMVRYCIKKPTLWGFCREHLPQ